MIAALIAASLVSCANSRSDVGDAFYRAEIIRTNYGIPHITAADFGSLGYGEGYAAAQDHVCNIAHSVVVARGERAKYHGAGENNMHLVSDIVVRALNIPARAEREFAAQSPDDQRWITGYAAGFNSYVKEVGRDDITSWCQGAEWVREISPADLFARFQVLAQTMPLMAGMIAAAAPPGDVQSSLTVPPESPSLATAFAEFRAGSLGSNGWAFGKERTENGRGMLLANPHYPWTGTNRFWEKHLVIPGKLNLYGSHLIGIPGVAIGFNESVGWTHTVSDSDRVLFYSLDLVPGDPTSYYYDGEPRKLTAVKVHVPVGDDAGTERIEEHTVWFSHYGPMVVLPNTPWTGSTAISIRDANYPNQDLFAQWRDMGMSASMSDFKLAHRKWNAIPWVNTIATSHDGRAIYIDGSNVGRLSTEAIAAWGKQLESASLARAFYESTGLILLDGSDSRNEWQAHPEARIKGVVPFVEQPQHDRTDYVFNSNDSHWLTHVDETLTGYSPLYGAEETARTLRTRMNALLVAKSNSNAGSDGKFSLIEMQQTLFANQSLSAKLLLDDLVAACDRKTSVQIDNKVVNLTPSCNVLKKYDGQLNLDSKGAVLFREWITRYDESDYMEAGKLFAVPFDVEDPVNTPRELADADLALQKLGEAVLILEVADLALDTALRDVQFIYRNNEKIAMHGGANAEGIANIVGQWNYDTMAEQVRGEPIADSRTLTDKGYPITYGTSFLLSLSYTDDGPYAEALLTYGESGDPTSEHYTDQSRLFAQKKWRPVLYSREDIERNTKTSLTLVEPRAAIPSY